MSVVNTLPQGAHMYAVRVAAAAEYWEWSVERSPGGGIEEAALIAEGVATTEAAALAAADDARRRAMELNRNKD